MAPSPDEAPRHALSSTVAMSGGVAHVLAAVSGPR